jgi:hypothetical protein
MVCNIDQGRRIGKLLSASSALRCLDQVRLRPLSLECAKLCARIAARIEEQQLRSSDAGPIMHDVRMDRSDQIACVNSPT